MPLLDAALALALTLLALAGVTTLLVELGHRILRLKAKQFRQMVDELVEAEIVPLAVRKYLKHLLLPSGALPPEVAALVDRVAGSGTTVDQLTDDHLRKLRPLLVAAKFDEAETWVKDAIKRLLDNSALPEVAKKGLLREVEEMDTDELVMRLGKLELFQGLKGRADEVVARIEATYEEIAAAARDFFTRRAKIVSLCLGVALAFAVNADGYSIFRLYMKEPATAQRVIANQDKIVADWKATQEALAKTLKELQARPGGAGAEDVKAIRERIAALDTHLASLTASGIPIGYDRWQAPPADATTGELILFFLFWGVSVLITGLLIGLGGPFWYDVAISLSQARHILRGSGSTLPVTTGQAKRAAAGRPVSILSGHTVLGRMPVGPAAGGGRPANPRNVAAFEGTVPLSDQV